MRLPALSPATALAVILLPLLPLSGLGAPRKPDAVSPTQKAQQKESAPSITRLGSAQGWDAYSDTEKGHKVCYVLGSPGKSEPGDAKRAKIYASISHRPAEKVTDEVGFYSGYLFKEGSDAELAVDGRKFALFTNKDSAWAKDSTTEKALVAALAKGKQAVIKGVSARGTETTDTYALSGLKQALSEIDKACGVKR